jgi:hypothetical protein
MSRRLAIVGTVFLGVTLVAVVILASRPGDGEAPLAGPTASPPPSAATVASSGTPLATPIGHPGRVPTGIEAVDRLIAAVTAGDLDALLEQVAYAEVPCQNTGYGPRCDVLGVPDGTVVRGLSMGSCDAGLVEEDRVPEVLSGMLTRAGEPLEVWSIYRASAREGGDVVLLFTTRSAAADIGPVMVFHERGGQVVGAYSAACQDRVADPLFVDHWIVHPADLGHPVE